MLRLVGFAPASCLVLYFLLSIVVALLLLCGLLICYGVAALFVGFFCLSSCGCLAVVCAGFKICVGSLVFGVVWCADVCDCVVGLGVAGGW